jgi:hypothetical protein
MIRGAHAKTRDLRPLFLATPSIAWRPERGKAAREPRLSRGLGSWSMGHGDCRSDGQALNFDAARKRTVRVARQARWAASIAKYIIGSLWIGWGTWIRTKTNRVRVCCATVTPFPNGLLSKFNSLRNCSAIAPWAANRRPAGRRSTRSPPRLASPQLMRKTARHVTRSYDLRPLAGAGMVGDCGHLEAIDEPRQKPRRSRQQVWCVDAGRAVCRAQHRLLSRHSTSA